MDDKVLPAARSSSFTLFSVFDFPQLEWPYNAISFIYRQNTKHQPPNVVKWISELTEEAKGLPLGTGSDPLAQER